MQFKKGFPKLVDLCEVYSFLAWFNKNTRFHKERENCLCFNLIQTHINKGAIITIIIIYNLPLFPSHITISCFFLFPFPKRLISFHTFVHDGLLCLLSRSIPFISSPSFMMGFAKKSHEIHNSCKMEIRSRKCVNRESNRKAETKESITHCSYPTLLPPKT